jgi:hypothetical protein
MGKSGMVQFRDMWLALVKTIMNITELQKMRGISISAEEVLASLDGASCMEFASSFCHRSK